MFRRFAFIAALLTFAGLVPGNGIGAPVVIGQTTIAADSLLPLFSTESAAQAQLPERRGCVAEYSERHLPLQRRAVVRAHKTRRLMHARRRPLWRVNRATENGQ